MRGFYNYSHANGNNKQAGCQSKKKKKTFLDGNIRVRIKIVVFSI